MARLYRSCGSNVLIEEFNRLRYDVTAILNGLQLLTPPVLEIGTVAPEEVKHGAFNIRVDGVTETVAAGEEAFTAVTHDIADPDANPREAIYVLSVAAGGAITITKGDTAAAGAAVAPATPAGEVKMGEVLIQHDGSAIFDATTSALDAAHLTVTYTDEPVAALTSDDLTK